MHSVYLMYYHPIMVVKYRKVINDPISERNMGIYCPTVWGIFGEWNHDIDHVHVMFRAQTKTELSKFINGASSRLLKKRVSGNPGKTFGRKHSGARASAF